MSVKQVLKSMRGFNVDVCSIFTGEILYMSTDKSWYKSMRKRTMCAMVDHIEMSDHSDKYVIYCAL